MVIVDPDDAAFQAGSNAQGARDVIGADSACKTEGRVIGQLQSLLFRLELGQNTSSWNMRILAVTSANTVGST